MTNRLTYVLPESAPRGVLWRGPFLNHSGYAEEMRGFVLGLRERGEPVRVDPLSTSARYVSELTPERRAALSAAVSEHAVDHPVHVLHQPGNGLRRYPGAAVHVARSMFETDGLPADWVPRLNLMDEIWVPSAFNVDTFRHAGVTAPLRVVPGGVDSDQYRPGLAPLDVPGLSGTVFLSVFEWSYRKGWDVLLSAWARAFDQRDDVTLLLRAYPQSDFDGRSPADEIERRINTYLKKIGKSRRRVAPIVVMQDLVADEDMPRLYATADAYVSPTRGEGSGRPLLEALSCGLPVLATRWSGHLEFLHDDNSLLIDIDGLEAIGERQELAFYRGQKWARPSVEHLTSLLRSVAADPAAAAARGAQGRAEVLERWTWQSMTELVADRLAVLQEDVRSPRRPPYGNAPAVRWTGDQWGQHSLAKVNREWCSRLARSGKVDLEVYSEEVEPSITKGTRPELLPLEARTGPVLEGPAQVSVRHQWPPSWEAPEEGAWVVVQPWEFGGLPDSWLPALQDDVDEVWCYTEYVRDVYVRSGIPEEKLRVIPCGVDSELFRPEGPQLPLLTRKKTKLLFLGGTVFRKGIDVLLDSYMRAFGPHDDVCLVVKSTGSAGAYSGINGDDEVRRRAADPRTAEIEFIDRDLTDEQVAALYRSCDVLVHPYRGEGFGLPVAEAMACALPVIVTDQGACNDFCDESNAFLVPSTTFVVDVPQVGPSSVGYQLAQPDLDGLVKAMRCAVDDPELRRTKGQQGRRRIVADFSWERSAEAIAHRCEELSRRAPARFQYGSLADRADAEVSSAREAAEVLVDEGRLEAAQEVLSVVLEKHPRHAGVLSDLAVVVFHLGQLQRCLDLLDEALVADPSSADAAENHDQVLASLVDQPGGQEVLRAHALDCPRSDVPRAAVPSQVPARDESADEGSAAAVPERISYAQNGEDVRVWRALRGVATPFYVEVGASHPVDDSLTKALSDSGASGILFEADPDAAELLRQARPRDVVIAAAASSGPGTLTFYRTDVRGWGSVSEATADGVRDHVTASLTVPTVRVTDVLDELAPDDVHFLSIDVEGHEEQVLRGLDLRRWRPWILCIEATAPNSRRQTWQEWDHLVTEADYVFVAFDGLNRWYLAKEHEDLASLLAEPFNPLDRLVDGWIPAEVAGLRSQLASVNQQLALLASLQVR